MKQDATNLLTREAWAKRVGKLPPGEVLPEVPGLVKFYKPEITVAKEVDPDTGMHDIKFVISTGTLDRDDDVIDSSGWDVENYKKNPVVLFGHDYRSLPVAKAMEIGVEDDALVAVDRFTPKEIHPFGYMVYELVRGKFLRAASVGFKPTLYVFNDEHKGYDFSEQELLEHSIVPVPSNPEALMAASACGIDMAPMKSWAEKILDDDPEKDRVALWLPKLLVTEIYDALSEVAVSLTDTSTGEGIENPDTTTDDGTTPDPATPTVADININLEPSEEVMEKAIQALSDVVRELNEAVKALPEAVAEAVKEKLAEAPVKTPPPEDEALTEDDIKTIVESAVQGVLTATTGKLPE